MPEENGTPPVQLIIVNGQPAKCGCKMSFSDGGGHFSDVHYITLCDTSAAVQDLARLQSNATKTVTGIT
jgi:hypothetical protein